MLLYPTVCHSCKHIIKWRLFSTIASAHKTMNPPPLQHCVDVKDPKFDGVVIVTDKIAKLTGNLKLLQKPLDDYATLDKSIEKETVMVCTDVVPSKRVIFAPTGPLNRDQDDVRRFADAAASGLKKALAAGCKKPLFVRPPDDSFPKAGMVATLSALHSAYVPLELRDIGKEAKLDCLGVWCSDPDSANHDIATLSALEQARIVCRDIGGSDPERMAAPKVEEYLKEAFSGSSVKMSVISDVDELNRDYPLLGVVNRAANTVQRHKGRLIYLEYTGEGPITRTLYLVGKGITYDTGGADIKAGGAMAGMHRDKCGAAAVAGFMKLVSILQPSNLKVVCGLAVVRNSVGEESYVSDEIVTSRAGVRVRVGNTDAEGRMVMADVLCRMKEQAIDAVNPHLITIATLTGHAVRTVGPAYSIVMDNGPAQKLCTAQSIQEAGDKYGDPLEISTIRREDYEFHKGKSEYEDVLQHNTKASTMISRGHQGPAAFLIMASGLDKHGNDSSKPLAYSHIDIAGSSGPFPGVPSGSPIVALAANYILDGKQ